MEDLDALDRRIMYELDLNARLPATKMAKKLKKSKETVNFRINRLLRAGYLKGFYTIFNTSKLGFFYAKFYLKLTGVTPVKETEIMDYIRIQPRVAYHASMEGHYDCVVLLMVRGNNEVAEFLDGFMKRYGEFVLQKEFAVFPTAHRLNQRFLYAGSEVQDLVYPVELGGYEVDGEDKEIMNILSTEARATITEIAKKTGTSPKSVAYRIKRLEKDNAILGYVSAPNFEKIGLRFYQLNISLKDRSIAKEGIAYFNATNKCLFAIESIGRYDLVIEVHLRGERELKEIMDGFRNKFAGKYADCDVSTVYQEYVVVWSPFAWNK